MVSVINPFFVSGKIPEEYFCDRVEEAKTLRHSIDNQMNVVLTSPRRMGKTALVDYVFDNNKVNDDYIVVSVDILHTTTLREFIFALGTAVFECVASQSLRLRKKFVSVIKSLSASFGYDPVRNMPTFDIKLGDILQPDFTLGEIFGYLESVNKRCVVVIDEFQQITIYPEKNVEALLRSHIQKLTNTNFVFSGSRRRLMEEMFFSSKRPFFQSAKSLRLEPICQDTYRTFAQNNFEIAEKKLSSQAFDEAYNVFQGVTFYVQRIMKEAFAITRPSEECDIDSVKKIIDDYIDENDSRLREQLAFITESQKEVLYAVHEAGFAQNILSSAFNKKYRLRSPSSTQSAANKLLDYDLITKSENGYSISDPLLDLWLSRKQF
ncbi:MAG: ATP-binding protein [Bacteroidales bacterium]|nr:ATP-binding protein [Bacteroidales bacterium]